MAGKLLTRARAIATHRTTLRIAWLVVIGVIVYTLLPTLTKMPEQARQALNIKWYALGIGVALEVLSQAAGMVAFRRVLEEMNVRPVPRGFALARLWMGQITLATILPAGSVTASAMVADILRRGGANTASAATATALAKAISVVALMVFFVAGLAMSIDRLSDTQSPYLTTTIIAVPVLAVALAVIGAGVVRPPLAGSMTTAVLRPVARFRKSLDPQAAGARAEQLAELARTLLGSRKGALTCAISLVNWVLDWAVLVTMLWGLGYLDALGPVIVAYTVARISAMLPITPGGIGIVEVIMTAVLAAFGTPGQIAAIAVIAYRLIAFWLVNIIGAFAAATIRRGLSRAPAAAPG
ncbi:MAG: YbhN family protein [Solirubrobacterales bacterium]